MRIQVRPYVQFSIDRGAHASILRSICLICIYAFANSCVNRCIHLNIKCAYGTGINVPLSLSCTTTLDVPMMILMTVTVRMTVSDDDDNDRKNDNILVTMIMTLVMMIITGKIMNIMSLFSAM